MNIKELLKGCLSALGHNDIRYLDNSGRNLIGEIKQFLHLTKIYKKDLTKSQQDIIKEAIAQMVYLERQLDKFPDTPKEVNKDIERVV